MTDLERQLTDRLQRRAAAVTPRYDLEGIQQGRKRPKRSVLALGPARRRVGDGWQANAVNAPDDTTSESSEGDLIVLELEEPTLEHDDRAPRRRPPDRWFVIAAAAVVVAVLGTLAVIAARDDDKSHVAIDTPTPTTAPAQDISALPHFAKLDPGRYFIDPDADATTPLHVSYQISSAGWEQWLGAAKPFTTRDADGFTALSIATVSNVVTDGCRDHTPLDPPVGPSVDDLATALSHLAPFDVTAPPTDVTLHGYKGKHLALTVPGLQMAGTTHTHAFAHCVDGELHSWIAPINDGSFYGYNGPGDTEEFWILDVHGTRLVLVKFDAPQSPAQDIAERDAIFDSISIEP
jgi:hypothetical protein